jgi:hypothetical protein
MNHILQLFRISFSFFLNMCFVTLLLAQNVEYHSNNNSQIVIAQIDSIKITAEEYFYSYEYGPAFLKRKSNSKEKHLRYLINEKLLALDGYSNNIDTTRQVKQTIKAFNADLSTEEMFRDKILNKIKNTDDEIEMVITEKQIEVNLRWLYTDSNSKITDYLFKLSSGISFDSIFLSQLNDSTIFEDRSLNTTRYIIGRNNPALNSIIDTMETNSYSAPIHINDGWYIIYLDNFWKNNLISETEHTRLREESVRALTKRKMDVLSDKYVDSLMKSNNAIIKNSSFRILKSYLGKFLLDRKLYNKWRMEESLNSVLKETNITDSEQLNSIDLVMLEENNISINDFLEWFWLRDNYIKFNKASLQTYSRSLESTIWRMVRDILLTREAYSFGYQNRSEVQKQIDWWRDKIVYSAVKNEIKNSVLLQNGELNPTNSTNNNENVILDTEFMSKMFKKLNEIKKAHTIKINQDALDNLSVSTENDKKAIDFYTVKKGGLIPRTPYPTIDSDWTNWE